MITREGDSEKLMTNTRKIIGTAGRYCARALLVAGAVFAGCGGAEITSRWKDRDVAIDGQNTGWLSSAVVVKDERAAFAVFNDGEYLYVGLRTSDRELQRLIMRTGITWWFDREGAEKKRFGVRYPAGGGDFPGLAASREGVEGDIPEIRRIPPDVNPTELEIYAAGEGQHERMAKLAAGGIDARFHHSRDTLYYELVVPLAESGSHPFAIGAKPGTAISIGAETVLDRSSGTAPREGGGRGGAGEGRFTGRGRRSGGGGREGGRGEYTGTRPNPLSVWMKVHLGVGE
jgi:hypothetical protein